MVDQVRRVGNLVRGNFTATPDDEANFSHEAIIHRDENGSARYLKESVTYSDGAKDFNATHYYLPDGTYIFGETHHILDGQTLDLSLNGLLSEGPGSISSQDSESVKIEKIDSFISKFYEENKDLENTMDPQISMSRDGTLSYDIDIKDERGFHLYSKTASSKIELDANSEITELFKEGLYDARSTKVIESDVLIRYPESGGVNVTIEKDFLLNDNQKYLSLMEPFAGYKMSRPFLFGAFNVDALSNPVFNPLTSALSTTFQVDTTTLPEISSTIAQSTSRILSTAATAIASTASGTTRQIGTTTEAPEQQNPTEASQEVDESSSGYSPILIAATAVGALALVAGGLTYLVKRLNRSRNAVAHFDDPFNGIPLQEIDPRLTRAPRDATVIEIERDRVEETELGNEPEETALGAEASDAFDPEDQLPSYEESEASTHDVFETPRRGFDPSQEINSPLQVIRLTREERKDIETLNRGVDGGRS